MKAEIEKHLSTIISVVALIVSIWTAFISQDSARPNLQIEIVGSSPLESSLNICRNSSSGNDDEYYLYTDWPSFGVLYLISNTGGRRVTLTDAYIDHQWNGDLDNDLHGFIYDSSGDGRGYYHVTNFEIEYADVSVENTSQAWWMYTSPGGITDTNIPVAIEPGDGKKIAIWVSASIPVSVNQLQEVIAWHASPIYNGNRMLLPITLTFSNGTIHRDSLQIGISRKNDWGGDEPCDSRLDG